MCHEFSSFRVFPISLALQPAPLSYFSNTVAADFQFGPVILPIFSLSGCWGTYVPKSMAEPLYHLGLCDLAKWVSVLKLPLPIHLSSSTALKSCALEQFAYQNNIQP